MFCLDVHNEAIKSMRYPPDAYKKVLEADRTKEKEEELTDEEIRAIQEEDEKEE